MKIGELTAAAAFAVGSTLLAAVPEVTGVTMSQAESRLVTIGYTLSGADAVVTVDVQTNAVVDGETTWASIGGEAVQNAKGDVWRKVEAGMRTITWRPDLSWPDHRIADGGARAVVTAWALDNTPDYMVVDIAAAQKNTQRYYPAADFLPGGLFGNDDYRMTKLVMRKIMAKDVTWTMGSIATEVGYSAAREAMRYVTLTNNYYVGVFEITQAQWATIQTAYPKPSNFTNAVYQAMRPVEYVSYNEIRNAVANSTTADTSYDWPNDPNPKSFLGLLRAKTGLDFDLPSEAQWEFAARAGNGSTKWGDGSGIASTPADANLNRLGRYRFNGGQILKDGGDPSEIADWSNPDRDCEGDLGTAVVGSYAPNAWGLYDMHGNVYEWCLDWFEAVLTNLGDAVNINPSNPALTFSGETVADRALRSGSWLNPMASCRPAYRYPHVPTGRYVNAGFRVVCTAGLQ